MLALTAALGIAGLTKNLTMNSASGYTGILLELL